MPAAAKKPNKTFTSDEQAAMREYAAEKRKAAKGKSNAETDEADVLSKIAEMKEPDRTMATRIHAIVKATAPELLPKTWYGMPAYARDGKVVCFFQSGAKFKTRYATLGFSDQARLDDGNIWPNAYAVSSLSKADEAKIAALIKQAVS